MQYPKISIITPSYNQGEYIEQTIVSILEQGYPNLEYIIIDGGSTDNTVDVIKKYEDKITYWISEKDKGQTNAINKGYFKATGNIITWLCSDDYYEPNILFKVAEAFNNRDINLVCGNRRTFGLGIKDTLYKGWEAKGSLEETLVYGQYDQPPSFFRKEAWDNIFPLTESLHVYMDTEMWLRYLLLYGDQKVRHINELFAHGRFHATSKSVNEAVPCRRVLNTLYHSLAKQLGLNGQFVKQMENLERIPYEGKWNIKQAIHKEKLQEVLNEKFGKQFGDSSYIYRDVAAYFMYLGNAKAAAKNSWQAIKHNPVKLLNYRTLLYSLRKI